MFYRHLHLSLILCAVLVALTTVAALAEDAGSPRSVLIISIDGLKPAYYLETEELGLEIPNLRGLMARGAWARGVIGVYPSVTYPSHTTLITGVPPRVHGIPSNGIFDPLARKNNAYYWFADAIRVPTLISAAAGHGLTTASVSWPVSVGMDWTWGVPEIWVPHATHGTDLKLMRLLSTREIFDAVVDIQDLRSIDDLRDEHRVGFGVEAILRHRPDLTLVHIFDLDFAQHDHGPMTPQALAALEESDRHVGRLLAALEESGMLHSTLVVVVSDHGFLPASKILKPNVLLREAGLIETNGSGQVTGWKAIFQSHSGSAELHLSDDSPRLLEAVIEALAPMVTAEDSGIHRLLDRKDIASLGGSAPLVLDAASGFKFSKSTRGEWLSSMKSTRGEHGHAPDREELHASFLVAGPGLRHRGDLGIIRMTSIAPTIAAYLDLVLSAEAADPLPILEGKPVIAGTRLAVVWSNCSQTAGRNRTSFSITKRVVIRSRPVSPTRTTFCRTSSFSRFPTPRPLDELPKP